MEEEITPKDLGCIVVGTRKKLAWIWLNFEVVMLYSPAYLV